VQKDSRILRDALDADVVTGMEWGESLLAPGPVPPALAAEVRKITGGILPAWATHLASVPWLVRGFARLNAKRVAFMPLPLFDLIPLVVSQDNSCRYCFGAIRAVLSVQGYDDDTISRMERDIHLAKLSPAEVVALQFARKVSQANPRPTAGDLAALEHAGFSRGAVAEIAYVASFSGFHNRIATFFALPTERFTGWITHPLARLVRPLLARQFRGKPAAPVPLPPNTGPCAEVITALDGSPTARAVRQTVDEALTSPILPLRTKLLMFAVIGRALGCDHAEAEARARLAPEGFSSADVEEVLATLGSSRLDAREALLVPWARETVRYRPLAIQDRTRDLVRHMDETAVIEACGISALANSIARLSILLERC
jgi:AhpD family alkylhydroperoxidase